LAVGKVSTFHLTLPVSAGRLRSRLYRLGVIQTENTLDDGAAELTINLSTPALARLLAESHIDPDLILPEEEAVLFRRTLEHFEQEKVRQDQAKSSDLLNNGMVNPDDEDEFNHAVASLNHEISDVRH